MILESHRGGKLLHPLSFHSVLALSKDQSRVWVCDTQGSHTVAMFKCGKKGWAKERTYRENKSPLLMLELSQDEVFIIGEMKLS